MVFLNPLGSEGAVTGGGGGGGRGVVVVGGGVGGGVAGWDLVGSSKRTNFVVSVVVGVGKLENPLKELSLDPWGAGACAWAGGLGNPTGSRGRKSSSTSNSSSPFSSSMTSSGSSCEAGLAWAVGKKSLRMNGGGV